MRRIAYLLVQLTWGLPQTIAGAVTCLVVGMRPSQRFRCAYVTWWNRREGLSLGPFLFLPRDAPRRLMVHEYGHTIQSLVLGPLYLPLMALPSMVWAGLPSLRRKRSERGTSYYSFYTERLADWMGERVCGEPSMGSAGRNVVKR